MKRKYLVGILIILIALFFISIVSLLIFRHLERQAEIDLGEEVVTSVLKEIEELKKVGFSEQDEAIQLMRSQAQSQKSKIDTLKKQWHLFKKKQLLEKIDTGKLARLIQLNKKMIKSYAQDINEYKRLDLPEYTNAANFAKEHIIRLAISLADLKKQQQGLRKGDLASLQQIDRIRRMIEVNKESMDYYKQELHHYAQQNKKRNHPRMHLAKQQLTQKAKAINALEQLLE